MGRGRGEEGRGDRGEQVEVGRKEECGEDIRSVPFFDAWTAHDL